jgi:hypothetical protein
MGKVRMEVKVDPEQSGRPLRARRLARQSATASRPFL